jgi:hypothetical protein
MEVTMTMQPNAPDPTLADADLEKVSGGAMMPFVSKIGQKQGSVDTHTTTPPTPPAPTK